MAREQIPEHLGLDILVRLPIKSVVRFRSLSKNYNALTRKTSFITEHLSRSIAKAKNKPNFLVAIHQINQFFISLVSEDEKSHPSIDLSPPFIFEHSVNNIVVRAHSNGIIYLEFLGGIPRNLNPKILWNPATREVKFLPFPPSMKPAQCAFFRVAHGFGFDPKENDYKIVNIAVGSQVFWEESEKLISQVYSLHSDSWKVVNVNVLARYIATPMFNTYLNGTYHWLAESGKVEFVLCFDMSGDVFWKMNLPEVMSQENNEFSIRHSNIVVLNDRVGYVRKHMHSEFRFEIWMMNEYGVEGSWVRMFNLARGPCPEILLEFWKDDDDVFVLGGEEYQPLVLYNISEQQVVKEFPLCLGIQHHAFRYVESIVPLSGLVHGEASSSCVVHEEA